MANVTKHMIEAIMALSKAKKAYLAEQKDHKFPPSLEESLARTIELLQTQCDRIKDIENFQSHLEILREMSKFAPSSEDGLIEKLSKLDFNDPDGLTKALKLQKEIQTQFPKVYAESKKISRKSVDEEFQKMREVIRRARKNH